MPLQDENWNTIHASAYSHALMLPATATLRPHGGLRYRCPATGSFVLVTDEPTLAQLTGPHARLRCADCGEMHLMTIAAEDPAVAATDD
jgi:hypothetical protein